MLIGELGLECQNEYKELTSHLKKVDTSIEIVLDVVIKNFISNLLLLFNNRHIY